MWFKVCIRYHLIFACKYCKKLLSWNMVYFMKKEFLRISIKTDSKFCIDVLEVGKDHIHCIITCKPQVSITSIVRRLKQISMHNARLQYWELLSKHFWKERTFQSDWYFCFSIWNASPETIRRYIENQW